MTWLTASKGLPWTAWSLVKLRRAFRRYPAVLSNLDGVLIRAKVGKEKWMRWFGVKQRCKIKFTGAGALSSPQATCRSKDRTMKSDLPFLLQALLGKHQAAGRILRRRPSSRKIQY
jgi:hypothetical protein